MADIADLGSVSRGVWVRVPSSALNTQCSKGTRTFRAPLIAPNSARPSGARCFRSVYAIQGIFIYFRIDLLSALCYYDSLISDYPKRRVWPVPSRQSLRRPLIGRSSCATATKTTTVFWNGSAVFRRSERTRNPGSFCTRNIRRPTGVYAAGRFGARQPAYKYSGRGRHPLKKTEGLKTAEYSKGEDTHRKKRDCCRRAGKRI